MTSLDRLKLAREDYEQQEKLYNTLAPNHRFYAGIAALLGGWSISLFPLVKVGAWEAATLVAPAVLFWVVLIMVLYYLAIFMRGREWSSPRTLDKYLTREAARIETLKTMPDALGGKTPEQYAEDEMLNDLAGAYALAADVNRTANMDRQHVVTQAAYWLLAAVLALGVQGSGRIMYFQYGRAAESTIQPTAAPHTATTGADSR